MAVAGLLLTGVVGGPAASAQTQQTKTPETYVGSAAGHALKLKVAGQEVSAGVSSVKLDSALKAVAESAGSLNIPVVGGATPLKAEVSGNGTRDLKPESCATPSLTAIPGIGAQLEAVLSLGAACASSLAEVQNGMPHALSTGSVFNLDVNANTILAQLPVSDLASQLDPVLGGVGSLEAALEDALGTQVNLTDTLGQVSTALMNTKTLEVRLGGSSSESVTDAAKITSVAKSNAGVIRLFPVGAQLQTATGVEIKPIVEIEIGSSQASAVYDRVSGKSTPAFDPAIATIRVNTPVVDALGEITGFNLNEVKINPNLVPSQLNTVPGAASLAAVVKACSDAPNEFCVLEGTPIETRIAVASGRTVTNADGTVGAVADAVKIHALRNIGSVISPLNGGILLEIAHAEAGTGGKPAEMITVAVPEIPRELPRTGGTPWLPLVAVAGVAIALATRRTLAKVTTR